MQREHCMKLPQFAKYQENIWHTRGFMANIQYDLFQETTDVDVLKAELKANKDTIDNVRRGLFARHNDMFKLLMQQKEQIEILNEKMGLSCLLNKSQS